MASSVVSQLSQYTWLDSIPLNVETSDVDHVPAPKRAKTKRASSSLSVMIPEPMSPSSSGPGSSPYSSSSKNSLHRRRGRKGKSIYRGVCVTREGKWRAVIYKERKQLYLGVFESEVQAALAHDRAARHHFGTEATLNFLDEDEMLPPSPHKGHISPMHGSAKLAKSAPGVFKTETRSRSLAEAHNDAAVPLFAASALDFAFPFTPDTYGTDQLGLISYDIDACEGEGSIFGDLKDDELDFLGGSLPDAASHTTF